MGVLYNCLRSDLIVSLCVSTFHLVLQFYINFTINETFLKHSENFHVFKNKIINFRFV